MNSQSTAKRSAFANVGGSLLPALRLFRKNDPLQIAGATAFFTTFALPPIIFLLAQIFGLILSPRTVGRGLIQNISNNLGDEGAQQIRMVIRSIRGFSSSPLVIIFGCIFLVFVSTTLFMVIKSSLNRIWQVEKPETGVRGTFIGRLKSLGIIFLAGLLFLADIFFKSIESYGGKYFSNISNEGGVWFRIVFSELSSIIIVAAWFTMLFRFLSDGSPKWRSALAGGILTGLLFSAGRYVLRVLLVDSNIGRIYGPSGAFVLVLLFVFYTSFIMYYGACFIAVYAEKRNESLTGNSKLKVEG